MDSNVKTLMETTGCTETEAQQVLQDAGNDLSRALKLLDASQKETIVFQVEFESRGKAEGRGFFAAIFDLASDNILLADMVYPLGREHADTLDINMPATVFVNTLKGAKAHLSDRHRGTCTSNLSSIRAKMSSHFVQKLLNFHNTAQFDKVNLTFADIFKEAFGDDYTVSYNARSASLGGISSLLRATPHGQGPVRPEDAASKLFSDEPAEVAPPRSPDDIPAASPHEPLPNIVLICEPDIAPFNGKPARELIDGEEVIVKIKDGRESARYYAELLGGCIGNELVPLLVPIVKINKMSDTYVEAYVEFGPGIYGEFFIPPEVKVKTKAEGIEIYNPFQDEQSLFAEERAGKQIFYGLISLIVAIVLLAVVLSIIGFGG